MLDMYDNEILLTIPWGEIKGVRNIAVIISDLKRAPLL